MSQWVDRIVGHPVWQNMQTLGPAIDQALAREGIDAQSIDGLERIRAVLTFVGKRLAGADPQLLYTGPLDGISNALQNAIPELQAFAANGNAGHVANANAHADTVVAHLPAISYPITVDDWNALRDAGVAYRRTLEENLGQLGAGLQQVRSDAAAAQQRVADLGTEISTERSRLTSLASDFQSQFSSSQESRNREFAEAQTARQDKFAGLMTDYTQRLSEQNAEFGKQRDAAVRQYEENIQALKEAYASSAKAILDEIESHKVQVERLVGVIGNLGVTSGYLKAANHARTMTWIWQVVTVAAMGGVIWVAYKAFLPVVQGAFTWESFAGRVFVSLTVGVLAAYAVAQADKYFEVERRNRKLALELEALGPYIAPLPPEKQEAFRLQVGDRSFGHEETGLSRKDNKSPATVLDIFVKSKEFRELITAIVKAARG